MTSRDLAGPVLNQESPEPEGQTSGHQVVTGRDRVEERGHAEQDHGNEEQRKDHGIIIPTSPADEPTEEDAVFIRHLMKPRRWEVPSEPGPEVTAVRDRDGDVWKRAENGAWEMMLERGVLLAGSWEDLLWHAPLTDVTGEM